MLILCFWRGGLVSWRKGWTPRQCWLAGGGERAAVFLPHSRFSALQLPLISCPLPPPPPPSSVFSYPASSSSLASSCSFTEPSSHHLSRRKTSCTHGSIYLLHIIPIDIVRPPTGGIGFAKAAFNQLTGHDRSASARRWNSTTGSRLQHDQTDPTRPYVISRWRRIVRKHDIISPSPVSWARLETSRIFRSGRARGA